MVALAPTRKKYVTAFAGRRDSYQLPLALHENGRILKFITGAYDAGPWAELLKAAGMKRLETRKCQELPDRWVDARLRYEVFERALQRVMRPSRSGVIADAWFARAAAAAANADRASAILYEFQAEVGFSLLQRTDQRRILFHFHPHPGWEHPILWDDLRAFPEFSETVRSGTRVGMAPRYSEHTRNAWRLADHVIVASSCTRDSLLHVGCPPDRISVVPYGRETVEAEAALVVEPREDRPFLLWVGAGTPRKGLHHVCRAWVRSACAQDSRLVVVARTIDRGMERHLEQAGIKWIGGLPRAELKWYFRHAHAFIMPSLSEGFGQVYLEAIGAGCPVIGTRNSVLPDLTAAQPWIAYVEPGDISALAARIRSSLARPAPSEAERAEIARGVEAFTWERFRAGIEAVLERFD
jgi:glycosyltransferase involved in cell wall biosynthesis